MFRPIIVSQFDTLVQTPPRSADAIRAQARHVAKNVFPGEQRKGPARLQSDNAAEFEVPRKTMLGGASR